jgi:hypothetical protein
MVSAVTERELLTLEPIADLPEVGRWLFHAPRVRERYDVSPAWVVHHLLQHESEHRSEIGWPRRQLTGTIEGEGGT